MRLACYELKSIYSNKPFMFNYPLNLLGLIGGNFQLKNTNNLYNANCAPPLETGP